MSVFPLFIYTDNSLSFSNGDQSPDAFFKKKDKIQRDFSYIDKYHGGTGFFELVLGRKESIDFKSIDTYNSILVLTQSLSRLEKSKRLESYSMPIRMVHEKMANKKDSSRDPADSQSLSQELLFWNFQRATERKDILHQFLNFDGTVGRLALRTANLSNRESEELKEKIQEKTIHFPFMIELSGNNEYFLHLGQLLLQTQIYSLVITLLSVFIFVAVLYHLKALTHGRDGQYPPGILCFILDRPIPDTFDFSTILISSICFGIAVDDSVHLIHHVDKGTGSLKNRFLVGLIPVIMITLIFTGFS